MQHGRVRYGAIRLGLACGPSLALVIAGCRAHGPTTAIAVSVRPWSEAGLVGRKLTTQHFEIVSTLDDAELETALPAFLERMYSRYDGLLPTPDGTKDKLIVHVFTSRGQWHRFMQTDAAARSEVSCHIRPGGFTQGASSACFHVDRSTTLTTLAHQGWHQYAASRFRSQLPPWLNEGLACYLEAVDHSGADPAFAPQYNTLRINGLREAIQSDALLSLQEIVNTSVEEVISKDNSRIAQTYHAQVWALITFLRHGAGGRYVDSLRSLLRDVADGSYQARVGAARLSASTPSSISDAEATFHFYFAAEPAALADAYYDHMVRIARFER